jgi:diguanylate cyclase (GGDEF)-like protein
MDPTESHQKRARQELEKPELENQELAPRAYTHGRRARAEDFSLTLTRALLETIDLRRILYVILTGATAGDGLGFNRAFLWLEDEGERALRGQLAVGPRSGEEASRIWEAMEAAQFDVADVMARYEAFAKDPQASCLARTVERLSIPLPLQTARALDSNGEEKGEVFLELLSDVMNNHRPLLSNAAPVPLPGGEVVLSHFALVPLLLSEQAIGVLAVDNAFNGQPVAEEEIHDLQILANLAAVAVERARLYERLRRMAEQDGLTGLFNRRFFDERIGELFEEARRHAEPLSVILLDADRFKEVNDRFGHLAGDDLLRGLARLITGRLRHGDFAARYGGDELVAVLPRASGAEALGVARELCETAKSSSFGPDGQIKASLSAGVAELGPGHGGPADLLQDADRALYEAKRAGRSRAWLNT